MGDDVHPWIFDACVCVCVREYMGECSRGTEGNIEPKFFLGKKLNEC